MTAGAQGASMTQGWSVNVAEVSLSRQANRPGTGWASVIAVFAGGHTWAARMGHTGTEATRWTSGTQLVCQVAAGGTLGGTLGLVVTGACKSIGTGTAIVSYDDATILITTRGNTPRTGSVPFTLSGLCLSTAEFSAVVGVSGSTSPVTAWISDSSVTSSLCPKVYHGSLRLSVSVGMSVGSLTQSFSADGYTITNLQTDAAASNIRGLLSKTVLTTFDFVVRSLADRVGGSAPEASEWMSGSSIRCKTGFGMQASMTHVLTSGAQLQSSTHVFTYELPFTSKVFSGINFFKEQILATVSGSQFARIDSTAKLRLLSTSAEASRSLGPPARPDSTKT